MTLAGVVSFFPFVGEHRTVTNLHDHPSWSGFLASLFSEWIENRGDLSAEQMAMNRSVRRCSSRGVSTFCKLAWIVQGISWYRGADLPFSPDLLWVER
jgi:hypothetical protein